MATRIIRAGCEKAGHVWECSQCRFLRPYAPPEAWQFVNKSGVCPRCIARDMATAKPKE